MDLDFLSLYGASGDDLPNWQGCRKRALMAQESPLRGCPQERSCEHFVLQMSVVDSEQERKVKE